MFLERFGGVLVVALSWLIAPFQPSACDKRSSSSVVVGIERLELNADRSTGIWTASGRNASGMGNPISISIPATVPGGIYSDLEDNGLFSNPIFHETNDLDNKWVGWTDWTFSRSFSVTPELISKSSVVLVCEGLDTISQLFINDVLVGSSDNMFTRYVFRIKAALKVGQNRIRVAFRSPVEYAWSQYTDHQVRHGYAVVPSRVPPQYRGENHAQMIRKIQSQFSWDWGPSYPNSGIWKSIYIEGFSGAVIRDVMIFSTPSKPVPDETVDTFWNVTARVYYDASEEDESAFLTFHRVGSPGMTNQVRLARGEGNSVDISIVESGEDTRLWWPNGYGEQVLYEYNISLVSQAGGGGERSTRLLWIGFRTVELIEDFVEPEDASKGREFYFRVNGVKMYAKGSNSVPLHVLPERITESGTEWLLRTAKLSHQNMIRVWGGGMYESDKFFDFADEYGILIWQDFMFACAMYPATAEFRASVRAEVESQVRRLQHRASLALWAANNENEAALRGNWYGSAANYSRYKEDYVGLYIDTIVAAAEELDPSRPTIPSSPTNGIGSKESGWVALNPNHLKYGDAHFYDYKGDNWSWETFPRARFSSEYGYQSFPHHETLAAVADNISTWTWDSPMITHRQRHPGGQFEISHLIRTHFPFPANPDSPEAFPVLLYLAQVSQAMGQKTQTEFYRRLQDKLDGDGTGYNMGAMYWQLNDVWEGCSWASVELRGKWKLQMYYARKFFSPVLASPWREAGGGDVVVELISDSVQDFSGEVKLQIFRLSSMSPVFQNSTWAQAEFLRSKEVLRVSKELLEDIGCDGDAHSGSEDPCVVHLTLPGTPDNFLFLQYPKNKASLKDPSLQLSDVSGVGDGKTINFTVEASAVAPFTFLSVRGDAQGYFSDNGLLLTTPTKGLTYYSEGGISVEQFLERVEVLSLFSATAVA